MGGIRCRRCTPPLASQNPLGTCDPSRQEQPRTIFRSGAAGWAARLAAALAAMGASAVGVAVVGATDACNHPQYRSQSSRRPRTSTVSTTPHRQSSRALEAGRTTDRAPNILRTRSSRTCTCYTNLRSHFPRPRLTPGPHPGPHARARRPCTRCLGEVCFRALKARPATACAHRCWWACAPRCSSARRSSALRTPPPAHRSLWSA